MSKTLIEELGEFGQSIWLDYISRSMIETGKLQNMIDMGLRGMTSNPTIFDKAVNSGADYDEKIKDLHKRGKSTFEIYDDLTIRDIQDAADLFRPVYEETDGKDGYVSLEINPQLAEKIQETIKEGKRLYKKVDRPNVMFKVPSTDEGFDAIEELLSEGINVNVTLIFSLQQYIETAQAFLRGMKRLLGKQGDLNRVCSVASVFVSRVDTAVDKTIDDRISKEKDVAIINKLKSLRGKAAVANSKMIFQKYLEIFSGKEFKSLKESGARVQRVLWGSTGTKDPNYSDIKYVTELIGSPTINTVPEKTLDAFLDHGVINETLTQDVKGAEDVIRTLKDFQIDINTICTKLLNEGVTAFEDSFNSLLNSIETKRKT